MSESCTNNCSSCSSNCSERKERSQFEPLHEGSKIKKIIGVVSGKGGVGKSMVTSLLTVSMNNLGKKCAILDADITGPSIPQAFGIGGTLLTDGDYILPAVSAKGTKVMSVNLLLENNSDPVIWRGPVVSGVVKQFYSECIWGDVDYMFVDMPPGTSDVPLTVFQSLPLDGVIIVTSPQELVSMIVEKAVKMAAKMNVPVLGIVENMSYFKCPNCNEKHYIYGESHVEQIAKKYGIKHIAKLPIEPKLAGLIDSGRIEEYSEDWLNNITSIFM